MVIMPGIVWLASYPKSGNTWFRVFLTNLRGEKESPSGINELDSTPIASARCIFDEEVGFEASDLLPGEIDRLRPLVYERLAAESDDTLFMKVHDAYTLVDERTPLFPSGASRGAIYIVRNPLDAAVSLAHHSGWDYDQSISNMSDREFRFCGSTKKLHEQLRQKLLDWSGHVLSWTEQNSIPVCILRYEDMKSEPLETFEKAVRFAGLSHGKDEILKALELSSFEILQQQEKENDFRERSPAAERFFRKGEIGSWRKELTEEQAARIVDDHRDVMKRLGYLTRDDTIVF